MSFLKNLFAPKLQLNGCGPYNYFHLDDESYRESLTPQLWLAEVPAETVLLAHDEISRHALSWYLRKPREHDLQDAIGKNLQQIDAYARSRYYEGTAVQKSKLFSAIARIVLLFDWYKKFENREACVEFVIAFGLARTDMPVNLAYYLASRTAYFSGVRTLRSAELIQFRDWCARECSAASIQLGLEIESDLLQPQKTREAA